MSGKKYEVYRPSKEMPLVDILLEKRGFSRDDFFSLDFESLASPWLLPQVEEAVDRVILAISSGERIAIYADFDADGVPGAVVAASFFREIGYDNYVVYIPHRHNEGYGLHREAIDKLVEDGVDLIITIDVGIRENAGALYAKECGVDLIITDHHEVGEELPVAIAVVNPKIGDTYPDKMLCGAAVIWQLLRAVAEKLPEGTIPVGFFKWMLDMVGLATISDMVPLLGENRVLAHFGLKVLKKTRRPGLHTLYKKTGVDLRYLNEDDIGFSITPRINAASRMSHPLKAFSLFYAKNSREVEGLARHLEECNNERKLVTKKITSEARGMVDSGQKVVVVGKEDWNQGVLGLVANKLTEEYTRPAFVYSVNGKGLIKGSCRAPKGISVVDLMSNTEGVFLGYGGHTGAGGFSLEVDRCDEFVLGLQSAYEDLYGDGFSVDEVVELDGVLSLDLVNMSTYLELDKLAPFGVGNPRPIFLFKSVEVGSVRAFGKSRNHLELMLISPKGNWVKAIEFFKVPPDYSVKEGDVVDVVASVERSAFRGRMEIRLRIIDIV